MQPDEKNTDDTNSDTPVNTNETDTQDQTAPELAQSEQPSAPQVISPTEPSSESDNQPDNAAPVSEDVKPAQPEAPANLESLPPAAPAPVVSGGGKKKKLGLFAGIIAIVLLLAAGGAGAYFGLVLPNQPQKITQDALSNTFDSTQFKSSKFEGEIKVSGGDVGKQLSAITFEGAQSEGKEIDLSLKVKTTVTELGLDARSTDGEALYLRLSGLDGLDKLLSSYDDSDSSSASMIAEYAPLIAQLNDQWFVIDKSLLDQAGTANPLADNQLSKADAKRLGEMYKRNQFLNIDKKLADEDIHGVKSYHVQATVNKDKLKAFLGELKDAKIKTFPLEQKDIDSLNNVDFSKYPFEMWVSKKDRFLTQFAMSAEDKGTTYKIRIALKDINQPVKVEKPADAKSVLELLGQLSPALGGSDSPALMGL